MQSSHIMVIMIVMIVMVASVLRAKYRQGPGENAADSAETRRLREEVVQLRERLQVLERITVEKENSLAREIEELRER
jgi:Flp pilus assembly protein CpaB